MPEPCAEKDADGLRNAMVDSIKQRLPNLPGEVESAFRSIARHRFLAGVALADAYKDDAVVTQRIDGVATSSSSCPSLMALMLWELRLEPGHRVLEIGAGTGYNAALMSQIVGPCRARHYPRSRYGFGGPSQNNPEQYWLIQCERHRRRRSAWIRPGRSVQSDHSHRGSRPIPSKLVGTTRLQWPLRRAFIPAEP